MASMFEPFEIPCDPPRDDAHVAAFNNLTRSTPFINPTTFFNWIQQKKKLVMNIVEFHRTERIDADEEIQGWESRGDTPYISEEEQEDFFFE